MILRLWMHSLALTALALPVAGCGYTLGYRVPPDTATVAVPIFHNATFPLRRDVEYELTSLVRREFQARTPLRVVASNSADLVLRGTIVEFRETLVVDGDRDRKIESSLVAVVDVTLEDHRNGARITQRVRTSEPFSTAAGQSFDTGRQSALENLAERIVANVEYWGDYELNEEPS